MNSKSQYVLPKWPTDSNQLIEENINLVPFVVRRYCKKFLDYCDLEDMIGAGNVGLVKAARGYNPKMDRFTTYAVARIYGEIRHYLRDNCCFIHCDRSIKELHYQINKANLLNAPTAVIANQLDADEISVKRALDYGEKRIVKSLYEPCHTSTKHETMAVFEVLSFHEEYGYNILLDEIVDCLDDFEKQVFQLKYMLDLKQEDIGKRLGCSQSFISKILKNIRLKVEALLSDEQLQVAQ